MKPPVAGIILATILVSLVAGIQVDKAQPITILIGTDGSIDPPTDAIKREGDTYIISTDLNCSVNIKRNHILIEGSNHTVQGPGSDVDYIGVTLMASNVTIRGLRISGWKSGVYGAFNNNTIANNFFTNNSQGISIYANNYKVQENYIANNNVGIFVNSGTLLPQGDNNFIIRNQITNNFWAIDIMNSNGTIIKENNVTKNTVISTLGTLKGNLNEAGIHTIYLNNFVNNKQALHIPFGGPFASSAPTISPAGYWDNGTFGNYWSDYLSRCPNASEITKSGIGDVHYLIEESTTWERNWANGTYEEGTAVFGIGVDRFPMIFPVDTSFSSLTQSTTNPSASTNFTAKPPKTNSPTSSKFPILQATRAATPSMSPSKQAEKTGNPSTNSGNLSPTHVEIVTTAVIVAIILIAAIFAAKFIWKHK